MANDQQAMNLKTLGSRVTQSVDAIGLRDFMREATTPFVKMVALVVLGGDLIFAVIRAIELKTQFTDDYMFRLDVDGSYPEIFQYVKFFFVACLMIYLVVGTKIRWYLVWAASFLFLMLDDSLMIHERVSEGLAPTISSVLPSGIDAIAIGEFSYFAVISLAIAGSAAIGIFRSGGQFRRFSIDMILLLALGAVFAVSLDLIHGQLELSYVPNTLFAIVEDGGEMIVVSLIAIYSAMVVSANGRLAHWLTDIRRSAG